MPDAILSEMTADDFGDADDGDQGLQPTDADIRKEVLELRDILELHPKLYHQYYTKQAARCLRETRIFSELTDEEIHELATKMKRRKFKKGEYIQEEGQQAEYAYVLAEGQVRRFHTTDGKRHQAFTFDPTSIGTTHLIGKGTARFNARCSTDVVAYELGYAEFMAACKKHPQIPFEIIKSLSTDLRRTSQMLETPLLEQQGTQATLTATVIASSIESFYRSAMNAQINKVVFNKVGPLFPDMHIQLPTRVVYICGIKQIRTSLQEVDFALSEFPTLMRLGVAAAPGIIMSPFSSILEASNAGHTNPESMATRWMRGYTPRVAREIIFAFGINQLSDYFAERSRFENKHVRSAVGSVYGGIICTYFSHIPHNLSTMKLAHPEVPYSKLWEDYYSRYYRKLPSQLAGPNKHLSAQAMSILLPLGSMVRMAQVTGSFLIINGCIHMLKDFSFF